MATGRTADRMSFLGGAAIAAVIVVGSLVGVARSSAGGGTGYAIPAFDHPRTVLERFIVRGDGQAYAAVAQDPGLRRPGEMRGGAREFAYRAQRPLLAYLAWALSFGQPGAVVPALIAVNVLAAGAAALYLSRLARLRRVPWGRGIAALATPGVIVVVNGVTSEVLGLAFVAAALWRLCARPADVAVPAMLLGLAGLSRETFLVVSVGVAAAFLADRARHRPREAAVIAASVLPWCAWAAFLMIRVGHAPFGAGRERLGGIGAGLAAGIPQWGADDWIVFALLAVTAVAGLVRTSGMLRWVFASNVALGAVTGEAVWAFGWDGFTRILVLVPPLALATVRTFSPSRRGRARQSGSGRAN